MIPGRAARRNILRISMSARWHICAQSMATIWSVDQRVFPPSRPKTLWDQARDPPVQDLEPLAPQAVRGATVRAALGRALAALRLAEGPVAVAGSVEAERVLDPPAHSLAAPVVLLDRIAAPLSLRAARLHHPARPPHRELRHRLWVDRDRASAALWEQVGTIETP